MQSISPRKKVYCRARKTLPGFLFHRMIALQHDPTFEGLAKLSGIPITVLYENTMRRRSTLWVTASRFARVLKINVDKLADKVHFHE